MELNLRLNRLVDEGGRMLLEGFCSTCTITSLNLSGNSLSKESSAALVHILEDGNLPIRSLDLSCNEFIDEDIENMGQAAESNKVSILQCRGSYKFKFCSRLDFSEHGLAHE